MDQSHSHHHHSHQQQPQDVLAEARKNLQALIDSGLSRDLLHQLVDDGAPLQLTSSLSNPSPHVQQSQHQNQQHHQQQAPAQSQSQPQPLPSSSPLVPPAPQCPPPPVPRHAQQQQQQQQHQQQQHQQQHQQPPVPSPPQDAQQASMISPIVPSAPAGDAKQEAALTDELSGLFVYPPGAPAAHRARISVSSTSSASSGHASIWSTQSAASNMSWASAGSNCARMQAPLPLPPQMSSPTSTPLLNGSPMGGTINKQNIYWCTSCETSFKRKYDWKRHEDEFHERWRKYPCPEPGCNRSFWGSNSFNQHHKQCHGCTTCPHAEKVVKFLRKRKYWACGFCSALHPARERHVEHVARHFESGMTKGEWMHSRVVYGLLHQPLIHEAWDALVASKQNEYSGRRPRFSWHPSRTGRAQGFLEKENPGQLQDLLEFFSGDEGDAQWIVTVAYDLADIVMDNIQLAPPPPPSFNTMNPSAFPHHDPRVSYAPLPSLPSQQPMSSPASHNAQSPFGAAFQTPMFMPSQAFPPPTRPSPSDSMSQSSIGTTQSPVLKQEPHHPQPSDILHTARTNGGASSIMSHSSSSSNTGNGAADGMMDFEYSPATAVFEDWESANGLVMDESGQQSVTPNAQSGWGMMQYFGVPRVAS